MAEHEYTQNPQASLADSGPFRPRCALFLPPQAGFSQFSFLSALVRTFSKDEFVVPEHPRPGPLMEGNFRPVIPSFISTIRRRFFERNL